MNMIVTNPNYPSSTSSNQNTSLFLEIGSLSDRDLGLKISEAFIKYTKNNPIETLSSEQKNEILSIIKEIKDINLSNQKTITESVTTECERILFKNKTNEINQNINYLKIKKEHIFYRELINSNNETGEISNLFKPSDTKKFLLKSLKELFKKNEEEISSKKSEIRKKEKEQTNEIDEKIKTNEIKCDLYNNSFIYYERKKTINLCEINKKIKEKEISNLENYLFKHEEKSLIENIKENKSEIKEIIKELEILSKGITDPGRLEKLRRAFANFLSKVKCRGVLIGLTAGGVVGGTLAIFTAGTGLPLLVVVSSAGAGLAFTLMSEALETKHNRLRQSINQLPVNSTAEDLLIDQVYRAILKENQDGIEIPRVNDAEIAQIEVEKLSLSDLALDIDELNNSEIEMYCEKISEQNLEIKNLSLEREMLDRNFSIIKGETREKIAQNLMNEVIEEINSKKEEEEELENKIKDLKKRINTIRDLEKTEQILEEAYEQKAQLIALLELDTPADLIKEEIKKAQQTGEMWIQKYRKAPLEEPLMSIEDQRFERRLSRARNGIRPMIHNVSELPILKEIKKLGKILKSFFLFTTKVTTPTSSTDVREYKIEKDEDLADFLEHNFS